MIPALTHALGLATYGVWVVLISLVSLTSVLQVGLAPAVTFHLAQAGTDGEVRREILVTSFFLFGALGLLACLALVIGAHPIATLAFRDAELAREAERVLPVLGCAACGQFLRLWAMAAEAGLQRYDVQAWADGLGSIVLYGGLLVLAVLGGNLAVLATWWAMATLGALAGHWYLWRSRTAVTFPIRGGWNSGQARALLHFGVRQWPSQLGGSFFGQIDRVVVNLILGPTAAGIYAAGTSVAVRINELSAAPVQVVGPAIAAADHRGRQADLYRRGEALNALLAFGLAAMVMLGAQPLADLLVPAQAGTMASVLRIMAFCYGLYSINAAAFFAAQGVGRPSINSRWVMAAGCGFVLALVIGCRMSGIRGAAWANLAYALTLGINLEVLGCLGLRRRPALLTGGTFVASLATCFVVSSTALVAVSDPLSQVLLSVGTLGATGAWLCRHLIRVRASSLPAVGLLV